jgi:G:T/U-mismatch repair DNA glycosylase
MIDYKISKNARILFVGINPHPGSYRRGVPFSNNKMFWYLLNRVGLLQEAENDLKNDHLLKGIYDEKFLPEYGLKFCESRGSAHDRRDRTEKRRGAGRCKTGVTNHSNLQAESG